MGGQNEAVIGKIGDSTAGGIRIHQSAGCVHFHDDEQGLKAEVPQGTFCNTWSEMLAMAPSQWVYVDGDNKTELFIEVLFGEEDDFSLDVSITMRKVKTTDDFNALNRMAR